MGAMDMRTAIIERNTYETKIRIELNVDGKGKNDISTGIGFFDHMLTHISKHGFMDIRKMNEELAKKDPVYAKNREKYKSK